jgi:Carboxypeptidase regulatory-like domain
MSWSQSQSKSICVCTLLLTFFCNGAFAQNGTTSIRGVVTDRKGGTIAGASVVLENSSLSITISTTTDKDGAYQFLSLRPTAYTITVSAPGFATIRELGLQLMVATPHTGNFQMEVSTMLMIFPGPSASIA